MLVRLISGGLALLLLALGAASAHAQTPPSAGPVFRDGQTQLVPAFSDPSRWIRHDLWVETGLDSDGDGRLDRMHVDVTRPAQTDTEGLRVPVVYETSPYYAGVGSQASQYFWDVRQELGAEPPPRTPMPPIRPRSSRPVISNAHVRDWVPRGFAVVHSESPGTGLSQGCPTIGGLNETLAPKAVVDWLNGRVRGYTEAEGGEPVVAFWSTGRVGMVGTSYDATLQVAAASTGVAGLEAIVPVAANTSYYHYYRSNGLVRSPGGYIGEDVDVLFDFVNSGDVQRRDACTQTVRDGELAAGQDRQSGDYSEFWASRDYLKAIDGVRAATLLAHGLNDWNVMPEHSLRVYEALRARGVPVQLHLHQGGHGGAPPFERMNRWFTRYLYGLQNGVEREPRVWIVREDVGDFGATAYADYPNPGAEAVLLQPVAGGRSVGGLAVRAPEGQGTESLIDDVAFSGAALARAAEIEHRLLYATPELRAPLHLSGTSRFTVRLSSSRPAANLSVWLVTLPWLERPGTDGNVITRGWADPQNHASLTDGAPLVPGRFYEMSFDLQPDDQVIPAGRRIALMIFSSDREFTLWPAAGTELTIDLDRTRLSLPIVGGMRAWEAATRPGGR